MTVTTSLWGSVPLRVYSYTSKYLVEIANQAIMKCKSQYNYFMDNIVTCQQCYVAMLTMFKSRRTKLLKKQNIITYGCS